MPLYLILDDRDHYHYCEYRWVCTLVSCEVGDTILRYINDQVFSEETSVVSIQYLFNFYK